MKKITDTINHPKHYTESPAKCAYCGKTIECIDITRHMSFNLGNVVKYLWRLGKKDLPAQELKKARWYLEDEIKELEKNAEKKKADRLE